MKTMTKPEKVKMVQAATQWAHDSIFGLELQRLHDAALRSAFEAGYAAGHAAGYEAGVAEGIDRAAEARRPG